MLKISGLEKSYGSVKVLQGINLEVKAGEIVALMGPSGCGKSTTIRCINRLTEPDQGKIDFCGSNVLDFNQQKLKKVRQEIGFVFQHFNLIERLTVEENVQFGLVMGGMAKELAVQRARQVLEKVDLLEYLRAYPSSLSGGQQQRVGIARALALNPKLLLLDEPTAALDPILVREVLWVIEELARQDRTTMIIVTHELFFALRIAHRIVLMDEGKIVETGKPEEIFRSPQSLIGQKYKELLEYQREIKNQAGEAAFPLNLK